MKSRLLSATCRSLLPGVALLLAAVPAHATWSIIITDSATGEVGIASATCVLFEDLKQLAAAVVVGKGAGSAQAIPDEFGVARQLIFEGLKQGIAPEDIIAEVNSAVLGTPTRQYGIADTQELAAGFSGLQVLLDETFAGNLTGQVGTLTYAVQGNVLTGEAVLTEAE